MKRVKIVQCAVTISGGSEAERLECAEYIVGFASQRVMGSPLHVECSVEVDEVHDANRTMTPARRGREET